MIEFWSGKCVFTLRVAAVILRSGFVLLQRAPGGLILPGGRVEFLEHSRDALHRELWEELGTQADIDRLLWVVENVFDYQRAHVHQNLWIYNAAIHEDVAVETMRKNRLGWWPLADVGALPLLPDFLRTKLSEAPQAVEHVCVR